LEGIKIGKKKNWKADFLYEKNYGSNSPLTIELLRKKKRKERRS
jgi:hypothetical protein